MERREIPKQQRPTFNLDLVTGGWAAPFVIYPSIPGVEDVALLIQAAAAARTNGLGIWANAETLLAYEYRTMEKLFQITRKLDHPAGRGLRHLRDHAGPVTPTAPDRSAT